MLLKEKLEKRLAAIERMKKINNDASGRKMTAEEEANFDAAFNDAQDLQKVIEREQRIVGLESVVAADDRPEPRRTRPDGGPVRKRTTRTIRVEDFATPRLRDNVRDLLADDAAVDDRESFAAYLRHNHPYRQTRALQVDTPDQGGYLAPELFYAQVIQALDDALWIRGKATVLPLTNAGSVGVPTLDTDPADADWTAEIATVSDDSTMRTGKRTLTPNILSKRILVSEQLVRSSGVDAEKFVAERLAYKMAVTQEKGFLTGTGAAGQPLGVFTASVNGVTTARDVSTDNTTTAFTMDGLKNCLSLLKSQYKYRPSTAWLFHRDAVKMLSKLKDGASRYYWEPSTVIGQPDRLLGLALYESEYAPSTFTTGLYVGIVGDWSYYWIAELAGMAIKRADERHIETNQVGFYARAWLDGQPVLAEAFARVKLA